MSNSLMLKISAVAVATGGDGFPTSQPFSQEHLREYRLRAPNQRLSGKS